MIESAQYLKDGRIRFVLDGKTSSCPDDMANRYRKLIAIWEDAGNTITPYLPSSVNLTVASKLGVIRYLQGTGEWPTLRAIIHSDNDVLDQWNAASELHIDDPLILSMLSVVGWDQAKLQTVFNEAGQ